MNISRFLSMAILIVAVHLSAMNNNQDAARAVLFEGGSNTQLQMGRYFIQTHPDVVRQLFGCLPVESVEYAGHANNVDSISWSPNGRFLATTGLRDGTIYIWDVENGTRLKKFGYTDWVNLLTWSPDSNFLATCSFDGTMRIWDVAQGVCVKVFGNAERVTSLEWSPDGKFIASNSYDESISGIDMGNSTVRIWNIVQGACVQKFSSKGRVLSLAWSPNRKFVAFGSLDGTIRIWDIVEGTCWKELTGNVGRVNVLAWSPNGKFIAAGSRDGVIDIWDVVQGTQLRTLSDSANSILWSTNGQFIASGSKEDTVYIWDVVTGLCLQELIGNTTDGAILVTWGTDDKFLISGSWNCATRIWDLRNMCLLNAALDSLSVAQQSFIISLSTIRQRHHRPLIILPGTCARATFETLPECLRQLLLENHWAQLDHPLAP